MATGSLDALSLEAVELELDSADAILACRDDLRSNALRSVLRVDDFGIVEEPLVKPLTRASWGLLREE